MRIYETGVVIQTEEECVECEDLCRRFCHVIYQLSRLRDKNTRKMHVDLAQLVMDTLERQFEEKVDRQYRLEKNTEDIEK
jgi:hypothetical protein